MSNLLVVTVMFGFIIHLVINRDNIEKYSLITTVVIMVLYIKVYNDSAIKELIDSGYTKRVIIYLYLPITLYVAALFPGLIMQFTSYFDNTNPNFARKTIKTLSILGLALMTTIVYSLTTAILWYNKI